MRIDRPVYFQRITSGNYVTDNATNSVFGDYSEDTVIEVKQWASITDAGIDYISDKFLPALSDGDYVGAFKTFIKI